MKHWVTSMVTDILTASKEENTSLNSFNQKTAFLINQTQIYKNYSIATKN